MNGKPWTDEAWVVLGEQIAKARRAKGWDQVGLAQHSGNSINTISNYERGRAPRSGRIPGGVQRVAAALGWHPRAVQQILDGKDPAQVLGSYPELFTSSTKEDARPIQAVSTPAPPLKSADQLELEESGHVAQDTFVRQMKRYRKLQELDIEELAVRIARLGGELSAAEITRIENGTRLIRQAEAGFLAHALDTSVEWLLGSAFSEDAPEILKAPPTAEELEAEAKAMERRIAQAGMEVNAARAQLDQARHAEEAARHRTLYSQMALEQTDTQQRRLERQYQYLLGRIDSIRASRGDELIIQNHLVYEDDDE